MPDTPCGGAIQLHTSYGTSTFTAVKTSADASETGVGRKEKGVVGISKIALPQGKSHD